MTRIALDYSYARPSAEELRDNGIVFAIAYTGQGKPVPTAPYIHSLLDAGVGFLFVGESYATRGFEGYSAGFADAHYDNGSVNSRGYPQGCGIARALADTPNVAGHEDQIAEYARGYRDGLVDAGGLYVPGGYGPKAACEAARPYLAFLWGVWTWGYGWGMCPDPPPPDADLYQDANRASPVADTDANVIASSNIPYWGSYPEPPPSPAPKKKDAQMWIALIVGLDGLVHAYKCAGAVIIGEYDPNGPRGMYGIPQEALDAGLHTERVDTMDAPDPSAGSAWDVLQRTTAASQVTPSSGGGGEPQPCPPGLADSSDSDLVAETNRRIKSGAISSTLIDT